MDPNATVREDSKYRTPKLLGTTAFVCVNALFAVGASAVFSVDAALRWLIVVVLVLLIAWWIMCMKSSRREDRAKDTEISGLKKELHGVRDSTEREHRTRFANAVGAMFDRLQKESQDSQNDPKGENLIIEVLESLSKLMGGQDPRACLYEPVFVEDDGDPDSQAQDTIEFIIGRPTSLEYVDHRGRYSDKPRQEFCREDDWKHGMINVFDTGEPQIVDDTGGAGSRRRLNGKQYKTFVNVRTGIGPGGNGVLSVDSCTPGCLDQGHIALMHVFAKLLAVGMDKRLRLENRIQLQETRSARNEVKP